MNIRIRQDILDEQNSIYFNLNLDRNLALSKLNKVLVDNFSKEYDEDNGMWSEHLLLFSALSISHPNKIKSILEIGTFNGETAFILSKLFPNSKIVTIDLNNDNLKEVKEYSYAFDSSKSDWPSSYEIALVNPTEKSQSVKIFTKGNLSNKTFHKRIEPKGVEIFKFDLVDSEIIRLRIKSKMIMARPTVFRTSGASMDVFHG